MTTLRRIESAPSLQLQIRQPDHVSPNMCVELEHPDHRDSMWFMTEKPCWICGKPTTWVELNFQAWVCTGACTDEAWRRYWEADREIDRLYGPLTDFGAPGYKPSHQSNDTPGGDMKTTNLTGPPDGPDGPPPAR
jgi:hypothetical protein